MCTINVDMVRVYRSRKLLDFMVLELQNDDTLLTLRLIYLFNVALENVP